MTLILHNAFIYGKFIIITTWEFLLITLATLALLEFLRYCRAKRAAGFKLLEPGWDNESPAPDDVDEKYRHKVQTLPHIPQSAIGNPNSNALTKNPEGKNA